MNTTVRKNLKLPIRPKLAVVTKASTFSRDYEYVRRGTVSLMAGIDLHLGHFFAAVEDRHRRVEFIGLLKQLVEHYPTEATICVLHDNHSAHISKETMAYLSTRPGRFEYIHAPKHGSWLNLVECAFSKMARTFLRHIRVQSVEKLNALILQGVAEINAPPVVFRWNKLDLGIFLNGIAIDGTNYPLFQTSCRLPCPAGYLQKSAIYDKIFNSIEFQEQALIKFRERGTHSVQDVANDLNINVGTLKKWISKSNRKVVANAPRALLAEIEIGILSRQCLDRRIQNRALLEREVDAWQQNRNELQKIIE